MTTHYKTVQARVSFSKTKLYLRVMRCCENSRRRYLLACIEHFACPTCNTLTLISIADLAGYGLS